MRVLIIDDEISTRESIKVLAGFNEMSGDEIFEARNGLEGYQMIGQIRPDIIFLDMNMPVLDGADFLNLLDDKEFPARIIVVSGYTDFRYMKAAVLKQYVVDYIQKPIDEVQLRAAVLKITGQEQSQKTSSQSNQESREQVGVLCGIFIENYIEILTKSYNSSTELFRYFLTCQMEHQLHGVKPYEQTHEVYQFAFFFTISKGKTAGLREALNRVLRNLDNRYEIKALAIYCDDMEGQATDKRYMEICELLNFIDLNLDEQVIKNVRPEKSPRNSHEPSLWAGELMYFAEQQNQEGFEQAIRTITKELYSGPITIYELKILLSSFVYETGKRMNSRGSDVEPVVAKRMSQLYSGKIMFSKAASQAWLRGFAAEIWERMQRSGEPIPDKLLQIIYYIQGNYRKRISLSDVAEKFHFNSSTISRMFVRYLGINYIDYLNGLRFEKAEELLHIPELSISEIAERTGFESLSYFSKQFKKKYGISPQEYRKSK